MIIYAIDPGTTQSGLVTLNAGSFPVGAIMDNEALLRYLRHGIPDVDGDTLAIEQVANMGMSVGAETFTTVHWAGRFHEAWDLATGGLETRGITRGEVKMHLCRSMRAKDANIRQALIDRFGGSGATRKAKKCPRKRMAGHEACPRCAGTGLLSSAGPLAGITSHMWAALAVAVTCADTLNREEK